MTDGVYKRLAGVLDTLPNGFPSTESGVEIKLLKKIFTSEQADLFCKMRLTFETAEEIAARTRRPLEGLEERLVGMSKSGQLFMIKLGKTRYFKMLPWVFGIYEFQCGRLDREFSEWIEEYAPVYSRQFFSKMPQLMQVLPIEEKISDQEEVLPYEKVSTIIENGQSFLVNDCICKKEKGLLGRPCDRPVQVCLAVAPIPGVFDNAPEGRVISRSEAYALLKKTEEEALVHMTSNLQYGSFYICNCCKCCCGVLGAINDLGMPAADVVNSHYYAELRRDRSGSMYQLRTVFGQTVSGGRHRSGRRCLSYHPGSMHRLRSLRQHLSCGSRPADSQRPGETCAASPHGRGMVRRAREEAGRGLLGV
jgi:electron transport complex protein RnfB